jgi:hypothetical protein
MCVRCIFVGYSVESKSWKFWIPEEGSFRECRDCHFQEHLVSEVANQNLSSISDIEKKYNQDYVKAERNVGRGRQYLVYRQNNKVASWEQLPNDDAMLIDWNNNNTKSDEYENLSSSNETLSTANLAKGTDEINIVDALNGPEANSWHSAINKEIQSLVNMRVF